MTSQDSSKAVNGASRRQFLKTSTAAAISGALVAPSLSAKADGSDIIKVGLVGCGGRGSGAAAQALRADKGCRLVAMADAFEDRLRSSLGNLRKSRVKGQITVDEDHMFTGFDAGRKLINSGVDVVLLAEPPHFRPHHLRLAIEKGLHVFAEKPVAVDGAGVRSILETVELAKKKKLSIVSGLCWRYDNQKKATIQRVLDGHIGDIVAMQCTYNTGTLWHRGTNENWSDMEYQCRNWLYHTWLSGDHIAEQHIHSLDKMPWAMGGEYPTKCVANGGRQVRTGAKWGNIYDHFNVTYEWKNGVKAFASCRQMAGTAGDVSDHIYGSKGRCHVFAHMTTDLEGNETWRYDGPRNSMYQEEHDVLFKSIRDGAPVNNGEYMAKSTLMAIMGRMAAYTGQIVSFEQALNSQEVLGPGGNPSEYEWSDFPVEKVAMPGITRLR